MHHLYRSRFGAFLQTHLAGPFTEPSTRLLLLLAVGFVLSPTRHTVATYVWRAGAVAVSHFTRFYIFLGGPLHAHMDALWVVVVRLAERHVPTSEPLRVRFDETTCKKTGPTIEAASTYRNGAGTARQEYRTLYGVHFVVGELRVRLAPWPGAFVSVPIGLAVYLKQDRARALGVPYRRRSELARQMLDRLCGAVPAHRRVLSVQDGGYSTKHFLRELPERAGVVGRLARNSPLYAEPTPKPPGRPGPAPLKGDRLGTPLDFAAEAEGWRPHPTEPGAEIRVVRGLWWSVTRGRVLTVVLVRRPRHAASESTRWLEAFFTTSGTLTPAEILTEYRGRWSVEILLHEARESWGLGQDRCRRLSRVEGVNAFRLLVGACEVLFFAEAVEDAESVELCRYRPWYLQKRGPSLFDIHWAVRESLQAEGISPTVGFWTAVRGIGGVQRGDPHPVTAPLN